jgi:hypothetical protein
MAPANFASDRVMAPALEKAADAAYEALVVWWDCHTVAVLCPLCSQVEEHEPVIGPAEVGWRAPETLNALCCSPNVLYRVFFPWEVGLGKKKNWVTKRYETAGLEISGLVKRRTEQTISLPIEALSITSAEEGTRSGEATQLVQDDEAEISQEVSSSNLDRGWRLRKREKVCGVEGKRGSQACISLGSMKYSSRYSPQITLDELRLLQSERTSTEIKILARSATVNGVQVEKICLAVIKAKAPERRTVAILHEGGLSKPIIAVSGWERDSMSGLDYLIKGEKWTEEVRKLCKDIGHDLESHNWDMNQEGRYYACHAEKQVMTYFLKKHSVRRQDTVERLQTLQPQQHPQEAWIALDSKPCDDCIIFQGAVQDAYDVTFHFEGMGKIVGGNVILECSDPKTPSRKSLRNIQVSIRPETVRPETPSRNGRRRTQFLTPPDSGTPLFEKDSQQLRDYDDPENGEDGHPLSPCHRRNRQPFSRKPHLETPNDKSYLFDVQPALRNGKLRKRQRNEIVDEIENEPGNAQPLSPPAEHLTTTKRSQHSMTLAPESHLSQITPPYSKLRTTNLQPQSDRRVQWSGRFIVPAIEEVAQHERGEDQTEEPELEHGQTQAQQDDLFQVSTAQIPFSGREAIDGVPSQGGNFVDLTNDTDDDGDDQGSLFSP